MRVKRRRKNIVVLDNSIGKVHRSTRMFVSREEVHRNMAGRATIILLAVFAGLFGLFGIVSVLTEIMRPEIDNQLPGVSDEAAKFDDSDSLVLAAIKLDDEDEPEKLVLIRFEPSEERIYVSGIPLNTVAGEMTLAQHYAKGETAQLSRALAELIDCDTVYTMLINYVQQRKLINYFEGITLTLEYDINYQSPNNDRNLNVVAGTRLYTGWETARLLNYPDWEGGEEEHLDMYVYVMTQFLGQNFKNFNEKSLQKFFAHVCAYSINDIPTNAFHKANAGLLHLSQVNTSGETAMSVDLAPILNEDNNYVFEDDALLLLQAVFGDRDAESEE